MHCKYIKEEKSISTTVKQLSETLMGLIYKDSMDVAQKLSLVREVPYLENTFEFSLKDYFNGTKNEFGFDTLYVSYIIYNCDTMNEYYEKVYTYGKNSESSYDDRTMLIVTGMVEGQILPSFSEEVFHEVTHLYQYGNGMEKRVNLYDNVIKMMKSCDNKICDAILRITYMSFKHEQDAFAHQFYAKLKTNRDNRGFDETLIGTEYDFYKKLRITYFYDKETDRKYVEDFLSKLGMDCNLFEKRMNYGASRLKSKFKNAYDKYKIDTYRSNLKLEQSNKLMITKMEILNEYRKRYNSLEFDDELIYKF